MLGTYIPAVRERVRIKGRGGIFLVVEVNRERRCVSVVPIEGTPHIVDVSFEQIEPLGGAAD